MIGLVGEDDPADLAVGGGEEDLRHLEMEPGVLLHCDGGIRHWSSSGELYDESALYRLEGGEHAIFMNSSLRNLLVRKLLNEELLAAE